MIVEVSNVYLRRPITIWLLLCCLIDNVVVFHDLTINAKRERSIYLDYVELDGFQRYPCAALVPSAA